MASAAAELLFPSPHEFLHSVCDRLDGELLPDHARGRHNDVPRRNARVPLDERAHFLRDLNAVRVAGVRVAAVDDDRLRIAVRHVLFRHENGRALYEVGRIDARRRAAHVRDDERKVFFDFIFADPAMYAVGAESLGRTYAALNFCYHHVILTIISQRNAFVKSERNIHVLNCRAGSAFSEIIEPRGEQDPLFVAVHEQLHPVGVVERIR